MLLIDLIKMRQIEQILFDVMLLLERNEKKIALWQLLFVLLKD